MSKKPQNNSISGPEVALNEAQNFQTLRKLGLDTIIESGSNIWTDYNEHDPGITLLEILTYALSDLAYRTDFSIEDVLASQELTSETLATTQFYQAREILSVNPVSLLDFRKQISDLNGVSNAWVAPISNPLDPAKGVLSIILDPSGKQLNVDQNSQLEDRVRQAYAEVRNLSQDLGTITIRKPIELAFDLEVSIESDIEARGEEIIAQILLLLENHLSRAARFSTFEEAMAEHENRVDEVYEGPALLHGFLNDDSMLPPATELSVTELIPILSKMAGVKTIKRFRFRAVGPLPGMDPAWIYSQQFSPEYRLILAPIDRHKIVLTFQQSTVAWSTQQVHLEMKRLRIQERGPKLTAAIRDISIPLGKNRDIMQYLPIQEDFPRIFGLPPHGLPPGATKERMAKQKQFQAYLMIFDQIMADYLAQLAHLGQLFSWSSSIKRTYFFSGLENTFTGIKELLGHRETPNSNDQTIQKGNDLINNYLTRLAQLREDPHTFVQRRNQFLDHLLSRFGRQLDLYVSTLTADLNIASKGLDIQSYKIDIKQRVLENYVALSAQRGKGPVMKPTDAPFVQKFSGLRMWVETLLGMEAETLEGYRFNDRFSLSNYHPEDNEQNLVSEYRIFQEDGTDVSLKELMMIGTEQDNYRIMYNSFPYSVGQIPANEDLTEYNISIYQEPTLEREPSTVYRVEPVFETAEDALKGIESLLTLIRKYDHTSERVFLLENLLLRPLPDEMYLGLSLLNGKGQIWLQTNSWYSQTQLQHMQDTLEKGYVYYSFLNPEEFSPDLIPEEASISPLEFTFTTKTTSEATEVTVQLTHKGSASRVTLSMAEDAPSFTSVASAQDFVYRWMAEMAPVGLEIKETDGKFYLTLSFFSQNIRQEYTSIKFCEVRQEWEELLSRWEKEPSEVQWAILSDTSSAKIIYGLQLVYTCNSLELIFEQKQVYQDLELAQKAQKILSKSLSQARSKRRDLNDYWQAFYQPWGWNHQEEASPFEKSLPQYRAIIQDPYSYILTVVIPEWPSRFQDKGFQEALMKVLAQETPAHLWLNVIWLDKTRMQQYQFLYGNWWRSYLAKDEGQSLHRKLLMEFVMECTIRSLE